MKGLTKRLWAMALAVIMVFGLLPVVQLSADAAAVVNYRYTDDENRYIYNWGTREVDATFLSPNAEAFYTNNSTSYDALAALQGDALYTALQTLMTENHETITSYGDTKNLFQYTDCQGSGILNNKISSFYSGAAIGPEWDKGVTWNREHTWPKSKTSTPQVDDSTVGECADIMSLRPTASSENSQRSNDAYGESDGFYDPNSASGGAYDLRGDVSRVILYTYVRWGTTKLFGEDGVMESQEVLLDWMAADPVDTWELGRNDAAASITGTRNVFVDYPELAFALFEEEVPEMVTPSGEAMAAGMNYTITATSNDEAMGTVTVSGNIVNAFPAAGYYAEGYTVTAGEATVTANGNAFTVAATADCAIQINFAQLSEVQISYAHNGDVAATDTHAYGKAYNLPAYNGELPDGYVFAGWSATPISATETQPTVYKTGAIYTPEASVTLHAVYAYLDAASNSADGEWTLVTDISQLYAGLQMVIADASSGNVAGTLDGKIMPAVSTSFFESWIPQLPQNANILTLGRSNDTWTLSNANGQKLGETAVKELAWDNGATKWNITNTNGALALIPVGSANIMRYNPNSPRFTTYAQTTNGMVTPQLYVYDTDAGTLHYTTTLPAPCNHENTVSVPAQAPSATAVGWTAGTYCYDCGKYIDGREKVAPLTSCTLNFIVPEGVAAIPNTFCDINGITLPVAEAPDGYTFVGWTEAPVTETTEKQTFYAAGDTYKTYTTGSTNLYALYSISKASTGSAVTTWNLVESVNDIAIDSEVVIVAADYDYALSTTQNTSNRGQVAITKSADKNTVEINNSVAILTIKEGKTTGKYAFYTGSGYLYAASSSSNHLKTKATLDNYGSFTITIENGKASLVADRAEDQPRYLQYNPQNGIFSCYKNTQQPVCLYVKTTSAGNGELIPHYATAIGEDACTHEITDFSSQVAPSCTKSGWTGELICDDCGETLAASREIPATGHVSAAFVPAYTAENSCTEASWAAHYDCAECGKLFVSKDVAAAEYTLPVAPGHDCQADGSCSVCDIQLVTLGLTTVTLRASAPGVYYKGEFDFAESFESSVEKYGITASVYVEEPSLDEESPSLYTQGTVGALIIDILDGTEDDSENGKKKIYARAYVQLKNGDILYSETAAVSMRQLVQIIDTQFDTLKPEQQEGLAAMYADFPVVDTWKVPNLQAYIAAKTPA